MANSTQHDTAVAGYLFNPVTGHPKTIDTHTKISELGFTKFGNFSGQIKRNNTLFFIKPSQVPPGHKVTCCNSLCTMQPHKSEVYRIRMSIGGDSVDTYVLSPALV